MKKFVSKILLFFTLLGIISFLLNWSLPFYWGDRLLSKKIIYLQESPTQYNTILLGSSQVNRHINSVLFDEINNTKTFNVGRGGATFLESYYLLEHILENDEKGQIKNVLIHTSGKNRHIKDENLNTNRVRYHLDWKRYKLALKYYYSKKDYHQIYNHSHVFLSNHLFLGRLGALISYKSTFNPPDEDFTQKLDNNQGHFPYPHSPNYNKKFKVRKPKTLNGIKKPLTPSEKVIISEMEYVKNELAKRNINLYNIVPPNNDFHLKAENLDCLYLGDSDEIPEYYDPKYRRNRTHLDSMGARIYTKKLANEFKRYNKN